MKRLITIVLTILMLTSTAAAQEVVAGGIDGRGGLSNKKIVNVDSDGRIVGRQTIIDACDATTGWTALNTDTTGVATDLDHVMGTTSLEFDKVDGAANTIFGVVQKTLTSTNYSYMVENGGMFTYSLNVSSLTDIAYCLIRVGTSASHYNEWRVDDSELVTGWQVLRFNVDTPDTAGNTGNGWNPSAVTYVAVGCAFDLESNALADLRVDHIVAYAGQQTSTVEVTATAGWSTELTAIKTAVEIVDDWDEVHDSAVGTDGALIMVEARTSRGTAVANGDAVRPTANEYGELLLAGYTWLTNSIRTEEIDPLTEKHVEETLVNRTNITNATDYAYFDMDGYRYFALQLETSGAAPVDTLTMTMECSIQDDGTAPASCTYQDVTNDLFGVASVVDADDMWIVDTPMSFKYCRLTYVTAGGNNDADLTAYLKRMW
jgi:hypothetical protein